MSTFANDVLKIGLGSGVKNVLRLGMFLRPAVILNPGRGIPARMPQYLIPSAPRFNPRNTNDFNR